MVTAYGQGKETAQQIATKTTNNSGLHFLTFTLN
jgi:hypothetical protein